MQTYLGVILFVLALQIAFDASGDAFRLKKRHYLHHIFEVMQIVCWMVLIFVFTKESNTQWVRLLAYYIFLRFLIFDTIFNLIAGNKFDYIGDQKYSLYAKFWHLFENYNICTAESAANTFKYLIALPVVVCQILLM